MSSPWLDRGGTAQVGGSPLSHIVFLVSLPLFSLTPSAQRKKALQKRNAKESFRHLRMATNATRVGSAPPFREKVDENNSGFAVANSSPNQNLKLNLQLIKEKTLRMALTSVRFFCILRYFRINNSCKIAEKGN